MSTAEPLVPSRRLRSAAEAERAKLGRDLERFDARAGALRIEIDQIENRRAELRDQLALLARLAWDPADSVFPVTRARAKAAHLQAVTAGDDRPRKAAVRGARIRQTAVLLLASSSNPTRPIHYQQWYKLFRDTGLWIDAREPLAAFLTQITRSPVVRRAGAPGVYALDYSAPRALRERLRQLEGGLREPQADNEDADDIGRARKQRAGLLTAIHATERQLEEAVRSLGDGGPGSQRTQADTQAGQS